MNIGEILKMAVQEELKKLGEAEMNKTMFTRMVGTAYLGQRPYAVYNTRSAVMEFQSGMEGKTVNGLADRETQQAIAAMLAEITYNDPNSWLVTE